MTRQGEKFDGQDIRSALTTTSTPSGKLCVPIDRCLEAGGAANLEVC